MLLNALVKLAAAIYFLGILVILLFALLGFFILPDIASAIFIWALALMAYWLLRTTAVIVVWLFRPPMTEAEFDRLVD